MPTSRKPAQIHQRLKDFYWPVSDEWYPCYPRGTVRIRMSTMQEGDRFRVRVSVWGADDFGMELDRSTDGKGLAGVLVELEGLLRRFPNPLTQQWLAQQGFVRA